MPVFIIRLTNSSVFSWSGSKRILHETEICAGKAFRREVRISQRRSGVSSNAAPMPPEVENGFGHPQFRSTPDTSLETKRAAATASGGVEDPTW